jgi:hypothetical protein
MPCEAMRHASHAWQIANEAPGHTWIASPRTSEAIGQSLPRGGHRLLQKSRGRHAGKRFRHLAYRVPARVRQRRRAYRTAKTRSPSSQPPSPPLSFDVCALHRSPPHGASCSHTPREAEMPAFVAASRRRYVGRCPPRRRRAGEWASNRRADVLRSMGRRSRMATNTLTRRPAKVISPYP